MDTASAFVFLRLFLREQLGEFLVIHQTIAKKFFNLIVILMDTYFFSYLLL